MQLIGATDARAFADAGHGLVGLLRDQGLIRPEVNFLDIGCGVGRVARYLLDEGIRSYVGFDRHPDMVKWCASNITPVNQAFKFDPKWVSPSLPLRDVVRLSGGHHSTPGRWT